MNALKIIIIGLFLIFNSLINLKAQDLELQTVKFDLQSAALKEQSAFKEGNCNEVLNMMEDDITFLANGRKIPSKSIVEKFCNSVTRPFKKPIIDKLDVFPLTTDSGYTVRTLEYHKDEKTKILEYVTKIWKKTDGEWKISHLHSTVKEIDTSE